MRFVFRTDADATIGTGHLMRCLALAQALRLGGAECVFLCREGGLGVLAQRITDAGHVLLPLPEAEDRTSDADGPIHAAWLPGGQVSDAAACLAALAGQPAADWLVVDHYALDFRWQSALRGVARHLMVIDDLADRPHDCDLLLDQSLLDDYEVRYDDLLPAGCERLLGPRFALLREEFARRDPVPKRFVAVVPHLLVMFGGADPQDLTRRAVRLLANEGWSGPVNVVAGSLYQPVEQLREEVGRLPQGRLHAPAENVAALMRGADLALGSPGVASWERCACSLPAIAIAQADNQEGIGAALGAAGASLYLGRAETLDDETLSAALRIGLGNGPARAAMARTAAAVCDGQGVRRVVSRLLPPQLEIRRASADDAAMLFEWRNDEGTRRHFRSPEPLVLEEHLSWFEGVLGNNSRLLLVISRDERPLGCVRFDISGTVAEISIYLDPLQRGQGLGAGVLLTALDELHAARPEVVTVRAEVLAANRASAVMFDRCGFRPLSQYFEYRRPAP